MEKTKNKIPWSTHTQYIDIDTGELLDSHTTTNKTLYTITKKEKHATLNPSKTRGVIHYTKYYKRTKFRQLIIPYAD